MYNKQKPITGTLLGWHDLSGCLLFKPEQKTIPSKLGKYVLIHVEDYMYLYSCIKEYDLIIQRLIGENERLQIKINEYESL